MREQLLGYLLGALDANEQAEVERQLANDPQLHRELELLRQQLQPLDGGRVEYEPPGDLVARTCAFVEAHGGGPPLSMKAAPAAPRREISARRASFTLMDMLVTAGVCAAMAILFFPAVLESREQSRRNTCQNSLRQLGEALTRFSLEHDTFPSIPTQGPLSFAGIVPVKLHEFGLLVDASVLLCPGSEFAEERVELFLPTIADLKAASGDRLWRLKVLAGGAFGYNLGIIENNRYRAPVYEARANFVWAGDTPSFHLPGRMSVNHSGRGMNLLFEDGHIEFVTGYMVNAPGRPDDVLRSQSGLAEAGRHKDDSVIGPSIATPWINPVLFE